MKAWGRHTLLACAAAVILAVPASVAAFESPAAGPTAAFAVKGTHGYQVNVSISHGWSRLSVSKGADDPFGDGAEYWLFKGSVGAGTFAADFGHLGRISVHFDPSKKVRRVAIPFCHGGPESTRFGSFEGTIRFNGEGGYTAVDAARVRGTISSSPRLKCHLPRESGKQRGGGSGGKRRRPLLTTFSASSVRDGVFLEATHSGDDPLDSTILAMTQERDHGVVISRHVIASGPGVVFSTDAGLNSATLAAPAPFSGSAGFQRIDDYTSRWEGPLTVSFPGRPDVPLTGRNYSWSLNSARVSSSSISISISTFGVVSMASSTGSP